MAKHNSDVQDGSWVPAPVILLNNSESKISA